MTTLPALLQPVPSRVERQQGTRRVHVGDTVDTEELLRWLVDRGFERVGAIEVPGEFSMHGGIFDLFPADAEDPIRIELFGNEVDSIRRFDAETQRKLEDLTEVELTVLRAGPRLGEQESGEPSAGESAIDSLPAESWVVLCELADLLVEAKAYLGRLDDPRGLFGIQPTMARLTQFPSVTIAAIAADSYDTACHLRIESIERFQGPKSEALGELESLVGRDEQVLIACHNEGERARLAELLAEPGRTLAGASNCVWGTSHAGSAWSRKASWC